jgi:hypothetical protein
VTTPTGFEGFSESPEAPFHCTAGRSPAATWAEAESRLVRVLEGLGAVPSTRLPAMTTDRIIRWHKAIFVSTFPIDAGRLRGRS